MKNNTFSKIYLSVDPKSFFQPYPPPPKNFFMNHQTEKNISLDPDFPQTKKAHKQKSISDKTMQTPIPKFQDWSHIPELFRPDNPNLILDGSPELFEKMSSTLLEVFSKMTRAEVERIMKILPDSESRVLRIPGDPDKVRVIIMSLSSNCPDILSFLMPWKSDSK